MNVSSAVSVSQICRRVREAHMMDGTTVEPTAISLRFAPLTYSEVDVLARTISECQHVKRLSLYQCFWSVTQIDSSPPHRHILPNQPHPLGVSRALLQCLGECPWLEKLDLPSNHLTANHIEALARALSESSTLLPSSPYVSHRLTRLNLSFNSDLGDAGAHVIAQRLLPHCPNLIELNLSCCGLSDVGFEAILTSAAQHNRHLEKFLLDDNKIRFKNATHGLDILSQSTLRTLSLRNNDIDMEGLEALANSLQTNTTLWELRLQGNPRVATEPGVECLAQLLQSYNLTLRRIGVDGPTSQLNDLCQANQIIQKVYYQLVYSDRRRAFVESNASLADEVDPELPTFSIGCYSRALHQLSTRPTLVYQVLQQQPNLFRIAMPPKKRSHG